MATCLDCKFANWKTTVAGRMHPSGDGRCQWVFAPMVIPASMYFVGGENRPAGGYIDRKRPKNDCPTWEPLP